MKQKRKKNTENLDKQQIWNMVYIADRIVKCFFAAHRFRVREHMDKKECAERHDARDLMQFTHHKSFADFDSHKLTFDSQII